MPLPRWSGFLFFPLRGVLVAPRAWSGRSGWASSPALRPACACDRAGTSRGGAPRCSYETTPATPHRETPARDPHAPARWLLGPRGGSHHHPPFAAVLLGRCEQCLLGGRRKSAGAAGGRSLRSPRASDARAALGRRRRGLMRTPRGPGADRALRSWAEERAAAAAGETRSRTPATAAPAKQSLTQ